MADVNPTLSIFLSTTRGLNITVKRQLLAWDKSPWSNYVLFTKYTLLNQRYKLTEIKGWKNI